jgi:hypothetical protein
MRRRSESLLCREDAEGSPTARKPRDPTSDKQQHIDEIQLVQQTIARPVPVAENTSAKAKIRLPQVHAHLGVQMRQDVR